MARSTAVRPASPAARAWPMSSRRCASRASVICWCGALRWPRRRRPRALRRRARDRPLADEGHPGRSGERGRRAREAGVLWGELDRETQLFGLATVGGIVTHTGIAGLTLGGGIGWLMRKYGATVDNLLSVDLVTADGELVTASENENPDLFWGVRGGGGTSASSPRSSTACTRSGRPCSPGRSSTRSKTRRRFCASIASSRPPRPTSSRRSSSSSSRRHCRSCPRTCTASR